MKVALIHDHLAQDGGAEKLARDLLAQGADGVKAADSQGMDALLIIKDGKKFRTEMAGGFKEQYDNTKK